MTFNKTNGDFVDPNSSEIIQDITEENKFILQLVDTIPAKFYFDHEVQEKMMSEKHLAMDQRAQDLKRSFSGQGELSAKNKHKRARLDPLCQKSVSQIHQELNNKMSKRKQKKKGVLLPSASLTRAANIEELQRRLQERIDELQLKRKGVSGKDPKKKKLKNQEKKIKQKKVTLKKVNEVDMQANKSIPQQNKAKTEVKPKYNKEGKILYSKLDFSTNEIEDKKKNQYGGKKYKTLLKKAEKKKEELENLTNTNPEKANIVKDKEKWKKAILKSENVKLKDDPELLKKSMKKQEKIKKKKAKVWNERVDHTESKMEARQEKRTKNLQKRKKEKLDKKIKRAKKKGRVIPGF